MAYDNIISFGLNREDRRSGDVLRSLVPLLKASGVTDSSVYGHFAGNIDLMQGSDVIHYMNELMTTLIVSESYEHHAMAVGEALNLPVDGIRCTEVSFDVLELDKQEAKKLRNMTTDIAKLDVPKISSNPADRTQYIDHKDQMILDTVDDIIEAINRSEIHYQMESVRPVGGNEKAFALMDMRRGTGVDLDCTAYVGNNATDYPAMDIIRDNDGLSISFNGDAFAVRGSNVAVMSPNPIVAAVLISEFYIGGLEGVFDMIRSWDRDKLSGYDNSDRHLMSALLRTFPSKLPEVVIVNGDNVDAVVAESGRYRRKLNI
jgi:predicted HAD superfamily phosphohydrolase